MQRNSYLNIRLRKDECDTLKELSKSAEMNVSDYVRYRAIGAGASISKPNSPAIMAIAAELKRLGNNLNQAVKAAHEAQKTGAVEYTHVKYIAASVDAARAALAAQLAEVKAALGR